MPRLKGSQAVNAKLSEDKVREIRRTTEGRNSLARRFGVSPYTIRDVRQYITWSWLKD